jgi:hypothetical protein
VNKRSITWLLAALLALASGAAVPVVGARSADASSAIVWIARARAEQRISLRPRAIPRERATVSCPYLSPANPQPPTAALYQRPPPLR